MKTVKMAAIALIASVAGFGGTIEARAQSSYAPGADGRIDLGSKVWVREVSAEGVYEGTWIQRGRSKVYDGAWVFLPTGKRFTDVLEVHGVVDGKLVISRPGGVYAIPVRSDGSFAPGKASWVDDPYYYIEIIERR